MLRLAQPRPALTAMTISISSPEVMADAAAASGHQLIKLKLGDGHDRARIERVRRAVPHARLIADANQAWDAAHLAAMMPVMRAAGVEMIEQPLAVGADEALAGIERFVPVCADEACHTASDMERAARLYDVVNLKLDKTGGLTGALAFIEAAQRFKLRLMIGCMEGTSLGMAPAMILADAADVVDLDGPLLIGADRINGLVYDHGWVHPPERELWG